MPHETCRNSPPPWRRWADGLEPRDWRWAPPQIAGALAAESGLVWLDSAIAGSESISLLTANPRRVLKGKIADGWDVVEAALQAGSSQAAAGGLFGWVGFDGEFVLGDYEQALIYHHQENRWWGCDHLLRLGVSAPGSRGGEPVPGPSAFRPCLSREEFIAQVQTAKDYIAAGDIYQVNLAYPWKAHWPAAAPCLPFYQRLRRVSPAPHAAFLNLDETAVLSASPELFLQMSGRSITTRPIKGTRPRFPADPARDEAAARELLACDKERAELLMITDLERNDLGQVCQFGSVEVRDLWRVESFAQVFHLVSTVTGTLRPEVSHAAAFRACFPGGSISGAPKKRALEIIHELETHPRGLYTGAIGYFGYNGESQWSIAIRTAVQRGEEITFHVGSGIVADSVPEREWEETLHKAAGILAAGS